MHRKFFVPVLFACLIPLLARGQTSMEGLDCTQSFADICRDTFDDPSVCRLLDPPPTETLQTIDGFFDAIVGLPQPQRDALICARFGPDKAILGLPVYVFQGGYFSSGWIGKTMVGCVMADVRPHDEFVAAASKTIAYGGTPRKGPDTVDVKGTLLRVDERTVGQSTTHSIILDPCRITKMYRQGKGVTFEELTREAREATREQYREYMSAGLTPPNVTNLYIIDRGQSTVTLSWTHLGSNLRQYRVVHRSDRMPQEIDDGEVVYEGLVRQFTHRELTVNTTHYYRVFAQNDLGRFSEGVGVEARTWCTPNPTDVKYVLSDGKAMVSWTQESCPFVSEAFVVLRTDRMPASRNDGGRIGCSTWHSPCVVSGFEAGHTYYMRLAVPAGDGTYKEFAWNPVRVPAPQPAVSPSPSPSVALVDRPSSEPATPHRKTKRQLASTAAVTADRPLSHTVPMWQRYSTRHAREISLFALVMLAFVVRFWFHRRRVSRKNVASAQTSS